AVNVILSNYPLLLINLETGGGKTLLFFLPLKLSSARITIVIAPLIALLDDLALRASESGIEHVHFNESLNHKDSASLKNGTLVIASQDCVDGEGFKKFVWRLASKDRLDRVVLDEVHMTVTDLSYRDILSRA